MEVWKSLPGAGNRAATFEFFWDRDADGAFDRTLRVHLPIQLLDHHTWVGEATADVLALDGTCIFRVPIRFPNDARRMGR